MALTWSPLGPVVCRALCGRYIGNIGKYRFSGPGQCRGECESLPFSGQNPVDNHPAPRSARASRDALAGGAPGECRVGQVTMLPVK
jgi:hypothetical protein